VEVRGWKDADAARAVITKSQKAFEAKKNETQGK